MIRIRGLKKWFDSRRGRVEALRGIDLEVAEKEFCVLLGPSGCGKTTTLRCVAGLEKPDAGELEIAGVDRLQAGRLALVEIDRHGHSRFRQMIDLINKGLISKKVALQFSPNPEQLKMNLQGIFLGDDNRILG